MALINGNELGAEAKADDRYTDLPVTRHEMRSSNDDHGMPAARTKAAKTRGHEDNWSFCFVPSWLRFFVMAKGKPSVRLLSASPSPPG
jgi:hypothetical protein